MTNGIELLMDVGTFLPVILFLTTGYFLTKIIWGEEVSLFYQLPEIWLLGTASYILPVVILNIVFELSLNTLTYLHIFISFAILLRLLLVKIREQNIDPTIITQLSKIKVRWYHLLFGLISLNIIVFQILLPLRGWDALNVYIPNSLIFYLRDTIPTGLNNLTFYPMFKAPVNTLLHTYSFYLTGEITNSLTPVIFVISSAVLVIKFLQKANISDDIAFVIATTYLLSPYIYIHLLEFAYYQELSLGFYFSICMFSLIYHRDLPLAELIVSIAASMVILSKITGYSILLFIIIFFFFNQKSRKIYTITISIMYIFLIRKLLSDSYLDFLFVLIPLLLISLKLKSPSTEFHYSRLVKITTLPLIVGLLWIIRLTAFPDILTQLRLQYLEISPIKFQWYEFYNSLDQIYFENNHAVSSLNISLIYLLNYAFIPTLLIFKLSGIFDSYKNHSQILLWVMSFFSIWITYHGPISMRYLQPIIVPLFVIIGYGISRIQTSFSSQPFNRSILLFVIIQPILFYYPFIPVANLLQGFHTRFYLFQNSLFQLFVYIILITLIFVKLLSTNYRLSPKLFGVIAFLVILFPSGPHIGIYIQNQADLDQSQEEFVYDNRIEVHQLSQFLGNTFDPDSNIGIGLNIPGVAMRSGIPIIDLQLVANVPGYDEDITNETLTYNDLAKSNITFIITLTPNHQYYPQFVQSQVGYPFLKQPSHGFTTLVYINMEFEVWSINVT